MTHPRKPSRNVHVKPPQKKLILYDDFDSNDKKAKSGGHATHLYTKKDTGETWYIKEAYSQTEPIELEIIAGDLYRLFLGSNHPKTRYVEGTNKKKYVGVQGVDGFKNFSEIDFAFDDRESFAHILITAMLLAETDLKADNIGINANREVIKIDNDSSIWLPGTISNDTNVVKFTAADLDKPLTPSTYHVAAWSGGMPQDKKDQLASNPDFQKHCAMQILKILLCPQQLVLAVIQHNAHGNSSLESKVLVSKVFEFVVGRRKMLLEEAKNSNTLGKYLSENIKAEDLHKIFTDYVSYATETLYADWTKSNKIDEQIADFKSRADALIEKVKSLTISDSLESMRTFFEEEFCKINEQLRSEESSLTTHKPSKEEVEEFGDSQIESVQPPKLKESSQNQGSLDEKSEKKLVKENAPAPIRTEFTYDITKKTLTYFAKEPGDSKALKVTDNDSTVFGGYTPSNIPKGNAPLVLSNTMHDKNPDFGKVHGGKWILRFPKSPEGNEQRDKVWSQLVSGVTSGQIFNIKAYAEEDGFPYYTICVHTLSDTNLDEIRNTYLYLENNGIIDQTVGKKIGFKSDKNAGQYQENGVDEKFEYTDESIFEEANLKNANQQNLEKLKTMIKEYKYTIHRGGKTLNGKRYPESAYNILMMLEKILKNASQKGISESQYNFIAENIERELRTKIKETKGFTIAKWHLGKRDKSTVLLYQKILDHLVPLRKKKPIKKLPPNAKDDYGFAQTTIVKDGMGGRSDYKPKAKK